MSKRVYTNNIGRRGKRVQKTVAIVLLIAVIGIALSSFVNRKEEEKVQPAQSETEALFKVILPEGTPEIIRNYTGFTVSFNPTHHVPNYVAWELTADEVSGSESRGKYSFAEDESVYGCASLDDYRNSGYDRGHMAPAGDMKWDAQAMKESFYMSNICPQNHNLNKGDWKDLEELERTWAKRYGAVCIAAGPIYTDKNPQRIGSHKVAVPDAFFKVLLTDYPAAPKAYGFIFANKAGSHPLSYYQLTVDEVEQQTGMDFFPTLPDEVENKIEAEKPEI